MQRGLVKPNDLQLSFLPFDAPASLALNTARTVRRVERLSLVMWPFQVLWVQGDLSVLNFRLDKIEAHLLASHRLK